MNIPFEHILDELDALVYVADMECHQLLYANRTAKRIFGEDIIGKTCWEVIQKGQDGPCPFCTNHLLCDADGNALGVHVWEFENTVNGKWYLIRDHAIPWTDGRTVRLEIATEITERKRCEHVADALRDISHAFWSTKIPEEYYARVHEIFRRYIGAENFFVALADGEEDRVNFPYFSDEKMAQCPVLHGLHSRRNNTLTIQVIHSRKPLFITKDEILAKMASGEMQPKGTIPEIWLGVPLILDTEIIGAIAVQNYRNPRAFSEKDARFMASVSEMIALAIERSRNEQSLRESMAVMESIFRAAPVGIGMVKDRMILRVNEKMCAITGYPIAEMIGRDARMLYPDQEEYERAGRVKYGQIREKGTGAVETHWLRKDGSVIDILLNSAPIDSEDTGRGFTFTAMDITEHNQLEEQLRQSQKMEAVGQLAGGIAHDFNNLLQVINGYADLAVSDLDQMHPVRKNVEEILTAGEKARSLVHQLLAFSRRQVMEMKDVPVNDLIRNLMKMIRRVIGEHIDLDFIPDPKTAVIRSDPGQIEQAILNLCINARDAMPEGGRLSLCTSVAQVNLGSGIKIPLAKPGNYAVITVKDTGCGMDEHTRKQIFEPFYTTKETGKGSGLGLAMVFGIIRQHRGMIEVSSQRGRGSEFRIYLPVSETNRPHPGEPVTEAPVGGQETILMAEDEEMVRTLVQKILEKEGYRVLCARDGQEAIEIYAAHTDKIDLVFLDVVMPRRSGREVHDYIRKIRPDARILFTSGYNAGAIHTDFILEKGMELIQKPYKRQTLLRKIREMIGTDR